MKMSKLYFSNENKKFQIGKLNITGFLICLITMLELPILLYALQAFLSVICLIVGWSRVKYVCTCKS